MSDWIVIGIVFALAMVVIVWDVYRGRQGKWCPSIKSKRITNDLPHCDHKETGPAAPREKALEIVLGQAAQQQDGRSHKWKQYFQHWENRVGLATLIFVAVYTIIQAWQLGVIRDQERRQLRAYLGEDGIGLDCRDCDANGAFPFATSYQMMGMIGIDPKTLGPVDWKFELKALNQLDFVIKNFGVTPAYDFSLRLSFQAMPLKSALPPDFSYRDKPICSPDNAFYVPNVAVVGGGQTAHFSWPLCKQEVADIIMARQALRSLYIYGHMDYLDVFKRQQSLFFVLLYVPMTRPGTFGTITVREVFDN